MSATSGSIGPPKGISEEAVSTSEGSPDQRQRRFSVLARRRAYLVLLPLLLLLLLWVWAFSAEGAFKHGPNGKSFEGDYAMFASAAQLLHQGKNPYDTRLLEQRERAAMARCYKGSCGWRTPRP